MKETNHQKKNSQMVKFHPPVIMILVYIDSFLKHEFNGDG